MLTESILQKQSPDIKNSLFNSTTEQLQEQLLAILEQMFKGSYDMEMKRRELIHLVNVTYDNVKATIYYELTKLGFPSALLDLCKAKSTTIEVPLNIQSLTLEWTIGSSTACYFTPWTGLSKGGSDFRTGQSKMWNRIDSGIGKSKIQREKEKDYFRSIGFDFEGMIVKSNQRMFLNPNLPFISTRPDGLIYKRVGELIGIVEIKDTKIKTEDELWIYGISNKNFGLILRRQELDGKIEMSLRSGHPWASQLFAQMLCLQVEFGILAVKIAATWRSIPVYATKEELHRFKANCHVSYLQRLPIITISANDTLPREVLTKKGRPKKIKRGRKKQILKEYATMAEVFYKKEIDIGERFS